MIIVGLTGDIGSGKTTFAQYLGKYASSRHFESSDLITEVANDLRAAHNFSRFPDSDNYTAINGWLKPLPQILQKRTHASVQHSQLLLNAQTGKNAPELYSKLFEYLNLLASKPYLQEGFISQANKAEHRPLLQWLGGYLPHQIDAKLWYKELIRRARALRNVDLVTIGGVRYPADAQVITDASGEVIQLIRPQLAARDLQDITERERSNIQPNSRVHNNGDLHDLETCAAKVWEDLKKHCLKTEYRAH